MIKITNQSHLNHSRLIFTLLALLTASVVLPATASGQSRLESYLRNADLDSDGKIEPNEISGPVKRYLLSRGYNINDRHKIKDIVKAAEKKTSPEPVASKLKVPKFGVEQKEKAGVSAFSATEETVEYSESVTTKTRELFKRYDRNGNGVLDEGEITRMSWGSPRPSTNDTNGDGRLSFNEIQGRYHSREMAERRSEKSSRDSDRGRRDDKSEDERGRDDRRERDRYRYRRDEGSSRDSGSSKDSSSRESSSGDSNSSRATSSSASSSSSDSSSTRDRSRIYVEKYFEDRDVDKNGFLEGDELSKVRSKSKYDTNRDGKIGQDEMLAAISPAESKDSKSDSSTSSDRRSSRSSSRSRRSSSRASGSFTEVDTNADRLVQMHEFSEKWTQKQLDEFLAKDKNGDGVISPDEW